MLLKKIGLSLATSKKGLKAIGGIFLGVLILIFMPIFGLLAFFSGEKTLDNDWIHSVVEESMPQEQNDRLQHLEDTMNAIETEMQNAGFTGTRIKEAQVIFTLALYEYSYESDFVSRLVGCFEEEQTDAQLIAEVNAEFGVSISVQDFTNMMGSIRAVYIDISNYTDPSTKNNLDLVQWAIYAKQQGWGYVWGTYGQVLDEDLYNYKLEQYPDEVGDYADFIEENWLGGRTADCVGLIKGYGWLNVDTQEVEYGTNDMQDVNANGMYENATEKGTIDTIPEIPGLAVWKSGHIGIYIGDGKVVEAMGTRHGVVETDLASGPWTHWLKVPYITYVEETPEETQPSTEPSANEGG